MLHMKRLLAGLMALSLGGLPVEAIEEDHRRLRSSLEEVGITVLINPLDCWSEEMNGYYAPSASVLGICQDQAQKPGNEVEWTENDYDTLRHEAQHVIQDCLEGKHGDGLSRIEHPDQKELMQFVRSVYTDAQIRMISSWYEGVPGSVMLMELEAFAVAETAEASQISGKVVDLCTVAS